MCFLGGKKERKTITVNSWIRTVSSACYCKKNQGKKKKEKKKIINLWQLYQMVLRNPNKTIIFLGLSGHSLWWFSTHVMKQVQATQNNMEVEWEINICFGCVKYFMAVSSGACIRMPKLLDRCESLKLLFPRWQWRTVSTIWDSRLLPIGFLK